MAHEAHETSKKALKHFRYMVVRKHAACIIDKNRKSKPEHIFRYQYDAATGLCHVHQLKYTKCSNNMDGINQASTWK